MKFLDILTLVLLIIGGLNWGLVALNDFDLVVALFGKGTALCRLVYGLVGLSAIYRLFSLKGCCNRSCH